MASISSVERVLTTSLFDLDSSFTLVMTFLAWRDQKIE